MNALQIHEVANDIAQQYNNNVNNVQEKSQKSREPYRYIMYTLYPASAEIDGTDDFWNIVDEFLLIVNK